MTQYDLRFKRIPLTTLRVGFAESSKEVTDRLVKRMFNKVKEFKDLIKTK